MEVTFGLSDKPAVHLSIYDFIQPEVCITDPSPWGFPKMKNSVGELISPDGFIEDIFCHPAFSDETVSCDTRLILNHKPCDLSFIVKMINAR